MAYIDPSIYWIATGGVDRFGRHPWELPQDDPWYLNWAAAQAFNPDPALHFGATQDQLKQLWNMAGPECDFYAHGGPSPDSDYIPPTDARWVRVNGAISRDAYIVTDGWGHFDVVPILWSGWLAAWAQLALPIIAAAYSVATGVVEVATASTTATSLDVTADLATDLSTTATGTSAMGDDILITDTFNTGDLFGTTDLGTTFGTGGIDMTATGGGVLDPTTIFTPTTDVLGGNVWQMDPGVLSDVGFQTPDLFGSAWNLDLSSGISTTGTFNETGYTGAGATASMPISTSQLDTLLSTALKAYQTWVAANKPAAQVGATATTPTGSVTPNKNGTLTTVNNGKVTTTKMPPGVPYTFPDGTIVINNGDGTYSVLTPNGSTTTAYPSGTTMGTAGQWISGVDNKVVLAGGALAALLLMRRA